jgi:uncharacterized protein (DUF2147 family)
LAPAGTLIILTTFEWWFKQRDESSLNEPHRVRLRGFGKVALSNAARSRSAKQAFGEGELRLRSGFAKGGTLRYPFQLANIAAPGMVMRIFRLTAAVVLSTLGLALMTRAPALAADPLGTWLTPGGKSKVRISNCGGALCGKLVWLAEPIDPETNLPKLDTKNADASKRSRPLLGVEIVLSMKPSGTPDKWDGQVYNARDGQTYSGSFTMTGANTAELKGCVAVVLCQAETWTRSN